MKRVLIIQRVLPHYRVVFFEQLQRQLATTGIELRLVVGQPTASGATKHDQGELPWATRIKNRYLATGRGNHLVWQPAWRLARQADLVVVEQASRLMINYLLLATRPLGGPRVAFWGHGLNLDRDAASPLGETLKRLLARRADWWFCYTSGTVELVERLGVDRRQMTVVQNASDTVGLMTARQAVTSHRTEEIRKKFGLGTGPTAIALGSLYPNKRLQFLVEAADCIRRVDNSFQLVVIGDGPDRALIETAATARPWLRPAGALTGRDLAELASVGQVVLNPGLIGLGVLDAFALGLPVVTCDLPYHSPEIEYLEDGVNGRILARSSSPEQFAATAMGLLRDEGTRVRMADASLATARRCTVESMVENFAAGAEQALSRTSPRPS